MRMAPTFFSSHSKINKDQHELTQATRVLLSLSFKHHQTQSFSKESEKSERKSHMSTPYRMHGIITAGRALVFFAVIVAASVFASNHADKSILHAQQNLSTRQYCSFQPPLIGSTRHDTRQHYQDEKLVDSVAVETVHEHNYDPIIDWAPPPPTVVQQTIDERIKPLRRLTSPVFFSTDSLGRHYRGLGQLPSTKEQPLLIVGNHQLGGIDIWLIVPELIEERNVFVRGLGHPVIFQNAQKGSPTFLPDTGKQGTFGLYQQFGAVMATPKNFYRLLETKQAVLHFPGGAREAYHGRNEEYKLFWPDKLDFVRTAAKFNATIVPLSAIGAADSVYMLAEPETLLNLPFGLGDIVANSFLTVREAARYDERKQEKYIRPPPLVIPKLLPARHYFMFGKAFPTTNVDSKDRDSCRRLYQDIQLELYCGFQDLLRARAKDPFKDSITRFTYEQVTRKQAPTFSVKELNA